MMDTGHRIQFRRSNALDNGELPIEGEPFWDHFRRRIGFWNFATNQVDWSLPFSSLDELTLPIASFEIKGILQLSPKEDLWSLSGHNAVSPQGIKEAQTPVVHIETTDTVQIDWTTFNFLDLTIDQDVTFILPTHVIPGTERKVFIKGGSSTGRVVALDDEYRGDSVNFLIDQETSALMTLTAYSPSLIVVHVTRV